ncbi:MAG TPA: hypothetical protein VF556_18445 [Pyrinomonadaceae bacterium]|jgi:Tfp pilus assembly protein PilV
MKYLTKGNKNTNFAAAKAFSSPVAKSKSSGEVGFSLIEVAAAMVVILVALLGVFTTFTYTINYNAGNNSRAQALALLQREVELFRSAKFTPTVRDNFTPVDTNDNRRDITGGTKAVRVVTSADGNKFRVATVVDNDPFTDGVQTTNEATTRFKEIRITVTLDNPTPGWQTSVPATVILQRVRSN